MLIEKNAPRRAGPLAAVLLAAAGCAATPAGGVPAETHPSTAPSAQSTTTAPAVTPPRVAGYDYADPADVCRRFVAAFYSTDTTRDTGPGDAFTRAAAYATGTLAGQSTAASRDGRWDVWAGHRARLDVQVRSQPDMHPEPDSSVEAYRAARVTATPVGADGWQGWTERSIVHCTLRAGDSGEPGWRVAHYDVEPVRS